MFDDSHTHSFAQISQRARRLCEMAQSAHAMFAVLLAHDLALDPPFLDERRPEMLMTQARLVERRPDTK